MDERNSDNNSARPVDPAAEIDEIRRFVQELRGTPVRDAAAERDYREFVEAVFGRRHGVWDPAKHPRGAFPQNRGEFSPTGGGGGVNKTFVRPKQPVAQLQRGPAPGAQPGPPGATDAPASPFKTVSLEAPDTPAIWKGAVIAAKGMGLPTALLDWNQQNQTKRAKGDRPEFKFGLFGGGTMKLDLFSISRLERIGKAGTFNAATDRTGFGPIYNEAFHSWFRGNKSSLGWLMKTLNSQKQFGSAVLHKGEEAMSETVDQIVQDMGSNRRVLSYDEIMKRGPLEGHRSNLTPGHNEPRQDWHDDPGASKEMSEELYYATVWVLFNGSKDPAPAGGNRLEAMKKFFARKFRPEWDEQKVSAFAKSRYKIMMPTLARRAIHSILVIAAAITYCLAIAWLLGLVPGSFLIILVTCYVLASFISPRVRAICAACCAVMALLPWLGLGVGSFILMGGTEQSDRLLPTLTLPETLHVLLEPLYAVAEAPFRVVFPDGNDLEEFIYFQNEGVVTVRPFVVFLFWLGLLLAFGMSIATSLGRRRRAATGANIDPPARPPNRSAGAAHTLQ